MDQLKFHSEIKAIVTDYLPIFRTNQLEDYRRTDQITIVETITGWSMITADLMLAAEFSQEQVLIKLKSFMAYHCSHDPRKSISASKKLYDFLIANISNMSLMYSDFERQFCHDMGLQPDDSTLKGFFLPISRVLGLWIRSQRKKADSTLLASLAQFLLFPSKMEISSNEELQRESLTKYLNTEKRVQQHWSGQTESGYITAALAESKEILTCWLSDFHVDLSLCRHGNGSTYIQGDNILSTNTTYVKDQHIQVDDLLINEINPRLDERNPYFIEDLFALPIKDYDLERCDLTAFVPKNVTSLRTISEEPPSLQFLQQGVSQSLRAHIRKSHNSRKGLAKNLSAVIKLEDRGQNRNFAKLGSVDDTYATIDLSSASDSVSWDLVQFLFGGNPHLLKWLMLTRCTHTRYLDLDDNVEKTLFMSKFAPMGSACCFPIETLVFAAIAQQAINESVYLQNCAKERQQYEQLNGFEKIKGDTHQWYQYTVFGDDIIIPKFAVTRLLHLLMVAGFEVNTDKSFASGFFKESCGGNYFHGVDITPIKFHPTWITPHKKKNGVKSSIVGTEAFEALAAYANSGYQSNYRTFREHCIRMLLDSEYTPVFCDRLDQAPMIYSPNPTNWHITRSLTRVPLFPDNDSIVTGTFIGRWVMKHSVITTKVDKDIFDPLRPADSKLKLPYPYEYVRYAEWLKTYAIRVNDSANESVLLNDQSSFYLWDINTQICNEFVTYNLTDLNPRITVTTLLPIKTVFKDRRLEDEFFELTLA